MEDIRARIKEALYAYKTNIHQIFGDDKAMESKAWRQMNGAAITNDTLEMLCEAMPNISVKWLLTGIGDMYSNKDYDKKEESTIVSEPETPKYAINENVMVTVPLSLLNDLQEQIKVKDKQIFQILALKK